MAVKESTRATLARRVRRWFLPIVGVLVGVLVGLSFFTFGYANGSAYFGKDPQACAQCHAMNDQFTAWSNGGHRHVATCQDCHAPQDDPVAWALDEADNGFWHSLKFTFDAYPQNIKIRDKNRKVVQEACLYCHKDVVDKTEMTRDHSEGVSCLQCHSEVGHER
ncbi:cytochrome c nitrite reductase small subunit [Intrasporangium calvum]|uniref:Cytochrome c nitrite reductase small subunit n=1 Tax=Intrasporangium calvum TaxID=53358 RepID=A0ABT5GBW6_9MICO|nr:cytochrome c nitrite reductase small subunit [Intrasporangium calvum]MDC5695704.1 cytochrome c nitrite reductase small subunit [Intrasporangium calvum]